MAALSDDELRTRLARARLLVLDVDGVLTDGRVLYSDAAEETQSFDVKDGLGLNLVRGAGLTIAWITGRGCAATRRRADELGVVELHMNVRGLKLVKLQELQARLAITPEETISMGDDLFDLTMRSASALFTCPSDAHAAVLERADWIASRPGGRGAVRELCDALLVARNEWDAILEGLSS